MKSKKYFLGLITGLLTPVLFVGILFLSFQKKIESDVSIEVSSIEITDINGNQILLDSINDKGVLINFWATWCVPCIKEMPLFQEVENTGKIKVIALSNQKMDVIKKFIEKKEYSFMFAQYKVDDSEKINVLPTTLLLNRNQEVVWLKTGSVTKDELNKAIKILNNQ